MEIGYMLYLVDDLMILGGSYLCTVLPVNLVAVVFRRIVARRYNDTGNTTPKVRSAKDSSGVGRSSSNTYALMPFAAMHSAASSANSGE